MKRATRNAAKSRQEIIEKSAPVFNTHGCAGTKMQMLVEATGYQMGGIYCHFETKEALAKAAFSYSFEKLIQTNLLLPANLNAKEKLLRIIDNYKAMILNPSIPGGCPIMNTITEVDDTNNSFRELVKSRTNEILYSLEQILDEGKDSGIFRSTIEVPEEALYLFATFEGAILLGKLNQQVRPVFKIFDQIVEYLTLKIFL